MNKAYEYCKKSIELETTPKYVKLQMQEFINICDGKSDKYIFNKEKYKIIENILKLLIMPKGIKAGQTIYESSVGYQWLLYSAIICIVYKNNQNKRRYEMAVLEICRKNFKTFTIATIFIILFLMGEPFSQYFSVAPDGALSKQIRKAIEEIIKSSPLIYEYKGNKRFKVLRDYIKFNTNQSIYTPLSFSTSRMDGRMPNCWCCDEAGALNTNYPIEAMQKGQIGVKNKLGFIISTKYSTIQNPLEDEVSYCKKVLDGIMEDETRFSLLYEPDDPNNWETNDLVLKQGNPVSLEIPEIWNDLIQQRALAIAIENKREEFLTKNCNIIYSGSNAETYIQVSDVQKCKVANIDWKGRVVYLGLDLSQTNDNTAIGMVSVDDDNNILFDSIAFIPEGRLEEKNAYEKIDYRAFIRAMKCIACGDRVIDYSVVEDFIMNIENKYGVQVQAIGYDRYNCLSTASKLEKAGYNTVEIRQHSSVLHSPTKLFKEKILNGEAKYTENKLLEINFQNAKCTYDTNKNLYVSKKKSNGKVDMVVALINAMYLLEQDVMLNSMDFTIQVL